MGEFFSGWKGTLGMLSLLMACVFMALWVRSSRIRDTLQLRVTKHTCHLFISNNSSLVWQSLHDRKSPQDDLMTFCVWQEPVWSLSSRRRRGKGNGDDYSHSFSCRLSPQSNTDRPFEFDDIQVRFWEVPHWFFALPLTLISAFLLLSRPRQSVQKKITESIPNEGGA